jgi:hypothetical protein
LFSSAYEETSVKSFVRDAFHDFDRSADHENRVALLITPLVLNQVLKYCYRSGLPSLYEADDFSHNLYMGFTMSLKDIITLKASQIIESGILSWEIRTKNQMDELLNKPQEIGPQVLTFQHLRAGFVVIFGFLGASIVVFAAECTPKVVEKIKKFIEFCLVVLRCIEVHQKKQDCLKSLVSL